MKPTRFDEPGVPMEFIGPVDEELLLTVAVLQGRANEVQTEEFERRYVEDDAFHMKVGPLVEFWHSGVDLNAVVAEVQGNAAPPRHSQGAPVLAIPPLEATPARNSYAQDPARARSSRGQLIKDTLYIGVRIMAAASVVVGVLWFYGLTTMFEPTPDGVVAVTKVSPPVPPPPAAGRAATSPLVLVPHATTDAAVPADSSQGQRPTLPSNTWRSILDMSGATVSADSSASKTIELRGGSRVLVRPGSTVRHGNLPMVSRGWLMDLKGEAAIEVTREDFFVRVVSRAGTAMLLPGSYAVRCVAACTSLEVSVDSGLAVLSADARPPEKPTMQLQAGQHGRAFRDSVKVVTSPEEAKAFPKADPSIRRVP